MLSLWWLTALVCSFICGLYNSINQVYKMPGLQIMIYRGLGVGILLLPFIFLFEPINNPLFYVFCTAQGFAIAFNDYRFFRATKAFGAEVSSSLHPLSLGVIFVFWLLITPSQVEYFIANPKKLLIVITCLFGVAFSVLKMCRAKASKKAFNYLLPVLFTLAIGDILNKKSMQYGAENLVSAVFYYMLITGIICGICNLIVFLLRRRTEVKTITKPQSLYHGIFIAILVIVLMVFKNYAMYLTPNPAYVSAIILLYPLWIIWANNIYLHLKYTKATFNNHGNYPRVGLPYVIILLASVIGLILLH